MKYNIDNINLKIVDFNTNSSNIINSKLFIYNRNLDIRFKIINYLGKGTIGQVYLLEPYYGLKSDDLLVVKISNSNCQEDLEKEVNKVSKYFEEGQIDHIAYPRYYGYFDNLNAFGAIYPYLGFYNLDKIKTIKYNITWPHNISIIKQLILQVDSFTNIIHGDLKPPNVVLDIRDSQAIATIVDFGLIKKKTDKYGIISTNYVSSPESLLTLKEYNIFKEAYDSIDYSKHYYFGLNCICINLFVKNSFWSVFAKYIIGVFGVSNDYLLEHKAVLLFVYAWYKFFYTSIDQLPSKSFVNLIQYIEKTKIKPEMLNKFLSWDNFFDKYIVCEINPTTFDYKHLEFFKDFLKKMIHFDSSKRPELKELIKHKFLNLD